MPTNFFPSNLQWFGLAKEVTYGVAIAAPTVWVPISSPKYSQNINPLVDQSLRGLMGTDFQQVAGMRHDEMSYQTHVYMDSVYQHMLALFGTTDAVTGTADPWTHKTALYNGSGTNGAQPPSYTGFYIDAAGKCWQIPGMVIQQLKLDVKVDELATLDITWFGLSGTAITIPTSTPSTNKPMPSWNSTITLGGSALTQYSEVSLQYTRDTKDIPTITGTQTPVAIYGGALSVSGSMTSVYQGSTDVNLADYLANTQPSLVVKIAPVGDAVHSISLQHSVVAYDKVEINPGSEWMELASTIKALMNATDALDSKQSPAQAIFLSASATVA